MRQPSAREQLCADAVEGEELDELDVCVLDDDNVVELLELPVDVPNACVVVEACRFASTNNHEGTVYFLHPAILIMGPQPKIDLALRGCTFALAHLRRRRSLHLSNWQPPPPQRRPTTTTATRRLSPVVRGRCRLTCSCVCVCLLCACLCACVHVRVD